MSAASTQIREEILYWCRESVRTGLNFNTQGNISVRLPEHEAIVITPSGIRYDVLTPDEMVVVGYDGVVREGDLFPSTETDVHLAHYRRRPEVNAIVHTESPYVNVFGALGKDIDPVLLNMVLYAKGAVPVMPFEFSTNSAFGERSAEILGDAVNAVVWANHGLLSVGEDLPGAFKVAVAVEANAQVLAGALALGTPRLLDLAEIVIPEGARLP
ncbi:class II aldolase/adducin family protein [Cellulomonas soli]|uniref:Fuculose phosphate aldolase n=1 Tax=Cellulomonas soli TaxID=931535 RepID=A0A512P8K0_9CELL|nr:class II aldolase/adducin family protein [Cellulomonas soli]NYI57684.1 L-ribulose-5-phosphate 4-epimerase [Cellulomonas soli]GEP67462.1 fuculose phosphate aldolase [Cellulomonas soli]